jgi:hypothetical protein
VSVIAIPLQTNRPNASFLRVARGLEMMLLRVAGSTFGPSTGRWWPPIFGESEWMCTAPSRKRLHTQNFPGSAVTTGHRSMYVPLLPGEAAASAAKNSVLSTGFANSS